LARNLFGCPLLTWTVRTEEQRARAARHADQMIFEGFMPGT
jgi:glycerophosphoryl diester phosphodiesterase